MQLEERCKIEMENHKQLLDKEYESLLQQFSKELEKLQIRHQQELEKKVCPPGLTHFAYNHNTRDIFMKYEGSSPLQLIFPEIPFAILPSISWCSKFPLCIWVPC
jgi:hypothetical protein